MSLTVFEKIEIVLAIVCVWLILVVPSGKTIGIVMLCLLLPYNLYMLVKSIDKMNNY